MHFGSHLDEAIRSVKTQPFSFFFFPLNQFQLRYKMQFLISWPHTAGCHDKESILNCNKWLQFIEGNGSHLSPAGQYAFEVQSRALLMNVRRLVYSGRQRHHFWLHVSGHIATWASCRDCHKAGSRQNVLDWWGLSLWHAVPHSPPGVRDGDNHCGFVCFIRLSIFKGQRLSCLTAKTCMQSAIRKIDGALQSLTYTVRVCSCDKGT